MPRVLASILVVVSAILLFWRLDGAPIWRHEATTAVWGPQMAESGEWIPWVYDRADEQLMVQAPDGHDVSTKLLPAMQSYLQFYVVGVSFALFGVSEWTARLPFALIGAWALWMLYRLGRELFGTGPPALIPPTLAVTSIFFLHAARQCRYYPIVIAATVWLMLELVRYAKDRERAASWGFYGKLAAAGFLLYFSNYVSFVGTWAAVGIYVLLQADRRLIVRFCGLSAVMAVPILIDFLALHAEFAGSWPPETPRPLIELYQSTFARRGRELWRMLPFVFVGPVAAALAWRQAHRPARALLAVGAATCVTPFWLGVSELSDWHPLGYLLFAAACLALPAGLAWTYFRRSQRGLLPSAAVLAGLILLVGPVLTVAAGKNMAFTRHFYQVAPAGMLLVALTIVWLLRRAGPAAAVALLAGCIAWPQLDWGFGGTEQVVWRQFLKDRSYEQPLIDFLEENIEPGDRVAFVRNVKGMTGYFYRPEMRWVGLLNADAPHNKELRGKIADDQFDDAADADWYVIWDKRDEVAKGLDDSYELVFEESYGTIQSWWERNNDPRVRTYRIYRRSEASDPGGA